MPTFYEGKPLQTIQVQLEPKDFMDAYFIEESYRSPFHHYKIKTGFCMTIAVLIGSIIPFYHSFYLSYFIPSCFALLLVMAAVFFYWKQPKIIKKWAETVFTSNQLIQLPHTVTFYRDSVSTENKFEKYLYYWTDFYKCIDGKEFYLFVSNGVRPMLIVPKKNMTQQQRKEITDFLINTFASRYRRVKM